METRPMGLLRLAVVFGGSAVLGYVVLRPVTAYTVVAGGVWLAAGLVAGTLTARLRRTRWRWAPRAVPWLTICGFAAWIVVNSWLGLVRVPT